MEEKNAGPVAVVSRNGHTGMSTPVGLREAPSKPNITPIVEPVKPGIDLLRNADKALELVREPTGDERARLQEMGFVIFPVGAFTLAEFIKENPDYVNKNALKFINSYPALRDFRPPKMEVAIKPSGFYAPGFQNLDKQLKDVEKYSKEEIQEVFNDARAIPLPASVLAQLDLAYFKSTSSASKKGQRLLKAYFSRTLERIGMGDTPIIGRSNLNYELSVDHLLASHSNDGNVILMPGVVFLRN